MEEKPKKSKYNSREYKIKKIKKMLDRNEQRRLEFIEQLKKEGYYSKNSEKQHNTNN